MTLFEHAPLGDGQRHTQLSAASEREQSVHAADAAQGGLLQFQLQRLIREILADPDLDPDIYISLIGHLANNLGHPEHVLLAHLRDIQSPDDLPPYPARRKRPGA